jgi:putative transposase
MFRTIAATYGVELMEIGGTKNHVHMLFALPPKIAVATLVRALKGKTSKWLGEQGHLFGWQEGYGSFSIAASQLAAVREYIQKQEEHHTKHTYESEFLGLLKRYGIEANPERVFG